MSRLLASFIAACILAKKTKILVFNLLYPGFFQITKKKYYFFTIFYLKIFMALANKIIIVVSVLLNKLIKSF